jgi:methionyl-tRNA synthetase
MILRGGFILAKKTFYITTPIYYPSDKLHIGHSYTTVAADAIARYKRMRGFDVMFLTGTDEHGLKMQRTAQKKGLGTKEYVDGIVEGVKELWKLMLISNDKFIRTTDEYHEKAVQKIFKKLYDNGDIYKSEYEGWYCTPCESFWTNTQLIDGKCPDCGREAELMKEESYFFRLSKYRDRIVEYIESHPDFIQPVSRRNEMLNNFLKPGLDDLCVTRTSFNWGIPVTFDDKHVIYVWIDALSNYITALGYMSEDDSLFRKYWPADVQLIGKEIVRFHTIIWPAMLMALGETLPEKVFGHGWLVLDGGKMSKSKGNVVDPVILVNKYGVDAIRYFLLREVPFGSDGNFSNEALIARINSDLANDLGNLVSRTTAMVNKYFGGVIPDERVSGDYDEDLINTVMKTKTKVEELLEQLQLNTALAEIWKTIARANKYIDECMPWAIDRDPLQRPRLAGVLYNLLESIRIISVFIQPFMPETPGKIRKQLGIEAEELSTWDSSGNWGLYPSGARINKGEVIFPRIDVKKEMKELEKITGVTASGTGSHAGTQKTAKEEISIDDFSKLDLRVAKVLDAEKVAGADKLLKLKLEVGSEVREVVSGIAAYYSPEKLVGKYVVLLANLAPAKIRGIESKGMILAASNDSGLKMVSIDGEIETGSGIS